LFNFNRKIQSREYPDGKWLERGEVAIPKGRCHKLAEAFAKSGGSLTSTDAKKAVDGRDLKSAKNQLCRAIKDAILGANSKSKPDATVKLPIEYDRHGKSYQCVVPIGHTETDDEGRLVYYDEMERQKDLEGKLIPGVQP